MDIDKKERKKEYNRLYCLKNKERKKEYDKIYKFKNKDKIKADRIKNKEHIKKVNKIWREKNKEILKSKKAEYFQNNKKIINNKRKIYVSIPEVKEKYLINHRIRTNKYQHQQRVPDTNMNLFDEFVFKEAIKLRMMRNKHLGIKWHIDHIIPISLGGTNAYHNIQVVPAKWNLTKSNKHTQKLWG
jgi:hypothetical protein